jgi:hypothetical protein
MRRSGEKLPPLPEHPGPGVDGKIIEKVYDLEWVNERMS